ncbi:MAG TPA: polysaccharide deacetylase family protein [Cyclobacteriaceae bacterium]
MKTGIAVLLSFPLLISCSESADVAGTTRITKWQYGKKGAISLTFDDGSINQFRVALPILNRLDFKGTFFIVTGDIPGSTFPGRFSGRPVADILKESVIMPTNDKNFFERASALAFLDIEEAESYHSQAGSLYEEGKVTEAHNVVDEGLAKARSRNVSVSPTPATDTADVITWPEIQAFASQGHEFGNHTVTHPRLAVLDETNLLYELEKGKEEILRHLGSYHTFSAECPYGTEDARVMEYALKVHPALRNRMPESFLDELNRWSEAIPGNSTKEYVQWQRGPLAETSMELMKSWVNGVSMDDNIWLVLVFHGVDGVGWEAKPHQELEEYFTYIKEHENRLWVATFGDVTRYMRERMNARVNSRMEGNRIVIDFTHTLDPELYSLPLTLKTYVNPSWTEVSISQNNDTRKMEPQLDENGMYVMYQAVPNQGQIEISDLD